MSDPIDMKTRTRAFALRVITLVGALPSSRVGRVLGDQLLRSGTSVGANYREAARARSDAEFVSKLGQAQQELEEAMYFMELLAESQVVKRVRLVALMTEAEELMAILVTMSRNAKKRSSAPR